MQASRSTRIALVIYGIVILVLLYLPLVSVGFASVSRARYLSFPIRRYTTDWYVKALESSTVSDLITTSLKVALIVTVISMVVGFFGALAFARYQWRFRSLFQKLILLPIFFPQAVLGLALLMWFNSIGVIPTWKTAIVAHLVWIAPIATLIIAIRAYSFDPSLEEAARDMGASTYTILREVTLPLLLPGVVSAGLFAFLLSWGNFPLSLFTTGVDSTLPEWLYAKMVSGYSPLVPTVGILSVAVSLCMLVVAFVAVKAIRGARRPPRPRHKKIDKGGQDMLTSIKDKSVIVTGGSKGIGLGIARVFARQGAKVTIAARGREAAEAAVAKLNAEGGKVRWAQCDVSDWASVKSMVDETAEVQGGLDIMCANAGIFPQTKLVDMDPEEWDHVMATNLRSAFLSVKASIPHFEKAGKGRVVLTSSITGAGHGLSRLGALRRVEKRATRFPENRGDGACALQHHDQRGHARKHLYRRPSGSGRGLPEDHGGVDSAQAAG